jgi:hypothetical protein
MLVTERYGRPADQRVTAPDRGIDVIMLIATALVLHRIHDHDSVHE